MNTQMNIAIDGPAGAGKSTVAKLLAEKLEFVYIDTGAMYRALTWKAIKENVDVNDEKVLHQLLKECDIALVNESGHSLVKLNGQDVTEEIRNASVTNNVSYVAKHPLIRKEMVSKQQLLAANGGTVMDGRDIGTAVLPEANVKIFLTASVEERAKRRHEENISKGMSSDLVKLKEDIAKRDQIDSERDVAPLKQAEDAIVLDSTSMSIEEVVENIYGVIVERDGTVEH
ncbi:(d)CMP kinase [Salipaludibacillus agaradhaerens]|uniref:Cytidylate kinase n=1 Tax=Salipaludibacillus agaradhaerens TaxID=76935 RepID=A0A9Q4B1B1_SALAG|nr:(d)CMP kinase [Salipaludibacillus agaradhaerens]UJW57679.1 (d)CMP kinase [Bacillus sp. A116_S68]MCR6096538.1 (d)CMP kinase [Salipaludibacillus agaradhaerens]MCR6106557.1 (d)CMP kinase [Salipaludibacillus agaradhaerens]MCR6113903.1 (d)CMP kinase [Salipaludibacillus agaradhaerens]MCR6118590.1 (d)CMP kinase [Salipaludibacillus agaradhaerens]